MVYHDINEISVNQSYAGNTQLCNTHIRSLLVRSRHRSNQRQIVWLPIQHRVPFKRAMLVYRALHGIAPSYIARFCVK